MCMNLDGFNDIKVGDQLEGFMMEEEERVGISRPFIFDGPILVVPIM